MPNFTTQQDADDIAQTVAQLVAVATGRNEREATPELLDILEAQLRGYGPNALVLAAHGLVDHYGLRA